MFFAEPGAQEPAPSGPLRHIGHRVLYSMALHQHQSDCTHTEADKGYTKPSGASYLAGTFAWHDSLIICRLCEMAWCTPYAHLGISGVLQLRSICHPLYRRTPQELAQLAGKAVP